MITVSPAAAEQILKSAKESNSEGMCLRIAARITPEEALDYGMGFDETHRKASILWWRPAALTWCMACTLILLNWKPASIISFSRIPTTRHTSPPKSNLLPTECNCPCLSHQYQIITALKRRCHKHEYRKTRRELPSINEFLLNLESFCSTFVFFNI